MEKTFENFEKNFEPIVKFNEEKARFDEGFSMLGDEVGFVDIGHGLLESYIDFLEEVFSMDDWVNWYIFENDCGKRMLSAGYNGQEKPIKNIRDLWEVVHGKVHNDAR